MKITALAPTAPTMNGGYPAQPGYPPQANYPQAGYPAQPPNPGYPTQGYPQDCLKLNFSWTYFQ